MLDTYRQLLHDFALLVGLEPATLVRSEEVLAGGLSIGLAFEGDERVGDLLYFADLGLPPDALRAQVHQMLLEANHFWAGTAGATLGLQPETGRVVCCGRTDLRDLDANGLATLLDLFVATATFWRHAVHDELPAPEAPPELALARA